jgi:hypothetical protein
MFTFQPTKLGAPHFHLLLLMQWDHLDLTQPISYLRT